jgi:hypothetical protein
LSIGARRIGAFVLAHPGSVALVLLFGGLAAAVSVNALWMQSERHPAPLFRQAAVQAAHSAAAARRVPEPQATPAPVAATAAPEEASPTMLPPVRPAALGRSADSAPSQVKTVPVRHPAKDPIADILSGSAPVPPALIKPPAGRGQPIEKSAHPAAASTNDAIAGLIDQSAHNR